jgi:transcription initiation factor TFIIIB Brf1 subunit/transcription initiation factor TFIIB
VDFEVGTVSNLPKISRRKVRQLTQTSGRFKLMVGQIRISLVAGHMALGHAVRQGAQRLFALAVDSNFHKGRRKDYVVASCLYLQSRLRKEPHMLIDFSERLQVSLLV